MIGQIVPLFNSGHILSQEMLEALSDYSYCFGEFIHIGYADGIISGCGLTVARDAIIINQGILRFHGKLFLIKEAVPVEYQPANAIRVLKVRYLGENRGESLITYSMDIVLEEDCVIQEGQIELCRFTLQSGARLRYEYVDFEDRNTQYDTLNTIHSPFAAPGGSTLSPDITRAFAREMLSCSLECQTDIGFCLGLLSRREPVDAEAMSAYIRLRTGQNAELRSNQELYEGLLYILKRIKSGSPVAEEPAPQKRRTIIVS